MSLARDGPVRGRAGCRMAAIAAGVAQDAPPGAGVWVGYPPAAAAAQTA